MCEIYTWHRELGELLSKAARHDALAEELKLQDQANDILTRQLSEALQLLAKVFWNYHNLPDLAPAAGIDTYGFKAEFQTICDIDAFLGRTPQKYDLRGNVPWELKPKIEPLDYTDSGDGKP
jgi:hypothetical protein